MEHGDFTELARNYIHRPAYSEKIISAILDRIGFSLINDFVVADVGAGTGKLTRVLLAMDLNVAYAVEPNDAMRAEGIKYTSEFKTKWIKGTGEDTKLPANSCNWITMASSFHWTNPEKSLPEFNRVLKNDGYFTAIWNPRNISSSPLHLKIEEIIFRAVPGMKRVSSGLTNTKQWEEVLVSTGHFKNVFFLEEDYKEIMSKERYMNVWLSVNDIRVQAGEKKFAEILNDIEEEIKTLSEIIVPYKIRAWTAQKVSS